MNILDGANFSSVGHCIYCGSITDLRTEHILPFGLSGTAKLPKSTCGQCAKITGKLEEDLLRGPLWPVRVYLGLRSRTKHRDAPKSFPFTFTKNNETFSEELSIDEYPILLPFPIFDPPGYLTPGENRSGISFKSLETIRYGPSLEDKLAEIGADRVSTTVEYKPTEFARVLAKIAYSMAYAAEQIKFIQGEPFVRSAIIGKSDDIGQWVGTLTQPRTAHPDKLHRILIHKDLDRKLMIGEVQLFADSPSPSYGVILGKLVSK